MNWRQALIDWRESQERPGRFFAKQMREARRKRGLTQAELAEEIRELGLEEWGQQKIAKVEKGRREVTIDEALFIAAALGVNPLHLLIPRADADEDGDKQVMIAPRLIVTPGQARNWIKDEAPLRGRDAEMYYQWIPEADMKWVFLELLKSKRAEDAMSAQLASLERELQAAQREPDSPEQRALLDQLKAQYSQLADDLKAHRIAMRFTRGQPLPRDGFVFGVREENGSDEG